MMSAPRAISLDAAGTLIHVRRPVGETYATLARTHGIPVEAAALSKAFRTVFPRMSPLAFGTGSDAAARERQERDWWRTLVRACLGPHGQHPGFGAFFDELYAYYAGVQAWALYPEVAQVLDALDRAAIPAVVVSNFDSRLHGVLEQLGVHGRFRQVLCSSEVGVAKPDRRIFAAACEALGATPAATLHAGDSRGADFDGARAAGLQALLVCRGGGGCGVGEADTVEDLRPIAARIARPQGSA